MCEQCERRPQDDLHPYTHKLLRYLFLVEAGFPPSQNDLTLEEWEDLGRVRRALERREEQGDGTHDAAGH